MFSPALPQLCNPVLALRKLEGRKSEVSCPVPTGGTRLGNSLLFPTLLSPLALSLGGGRPALFLPTSLRVPLHVPGGVTAHVESHGLVKSHRRPGEQEVLAEVLGCRKAREGSSASLRRGPCSHSKTNTDLPAPSSGTAGHLGVVPSSCPLWVSSHVALAQGGTGHSTRDPPEPQRASTCRKSRQCQPLYL